MYSSYLFVLVIGISVAAIEAKFPTYDVAMGFDTNGANCPCNITFETFDSRMTPMEIFMIGVPLSRPFYTKDLKHINFYDKVNNCSRIDFSVLCIFCNVENAAHMEVTFMPMDMNNPECKKPISIHVVAVNYPKSGSDKPTIFSFGKPIHKGDKKGEFPSKLITPNVPIRLDKYDYSKDETAGK